MFICILMIVISCIIAFEWIMSSTSEIGKQMGKSVAPVLLLDVQYVESLNRSNAVILWILNNFLVYFN